MLHQIEDNKLSIIYLKHIKKSKMINYPSITKMTLVQFIMLLQKKKKRNKVLNKLKENM